MMGSEPASPTHEAASTTPPPRNPLGNDGTTPTPECTERSPVLDPKRGDFEDRAKDENGDAAVKVDGSLEPIDYRTIVYFVVAMSLAYFIQSGVENGVGPCSYTTMQDTFNVSTTSVAIAQNMAELSKTLGSVVYGQLGHSHHKSLFVNLGLLIWALGSALVGASFSVVMVGFGFFMMGSGYSATTVLCPAVLNSLMHRPDEKQKATFYLSVVYAVGALGVASGFVVCGATISFWRLNFILSPLFLIPVFVLLIMAYRRYILHHYGDSGPKVTSPSSFFKSIMDSQSSRPPLSKTLPTVLKNRVVLFNTLQLTFTSFYVTAFTQLIPKFVETQLGESKSTASFVMAVTVPAVCLGLIIGGVICRKYSLTMSEQLLFILFSCVAAIPMMLLFATDSLAVFIICLVVAMITVFLASAPTVTALALGIEAEHRILTDKERRDAPSVSSLVSSANGFSSFLSRITGAITGPIILAALIDASSPDSWLTFRMAYLMVGMGGSGLATIFALLAWLSGRDLEDRDKALAAEQLDTELRPTGTPQPQVDHARM